MENQFFEILEKFYKRLYDNVLRQEKKMENNSVMLTLIKITSGKTSKLLNDSSIKGLIYPLDYLRELEKGGFIRPSDDKNKLDEYILTAKGIYEVENTNKSLDLNQILNYFQKKYFTFLEVTRPLVDTEKIIILSLIGARVFSIKSPMDLKSHLIQDYWLDIFKDSYKFLCKLELIKTKDLTFEKQGNEHPISYAMRRTDSLRKKTQHIFIPIGNKKYYLDISENDKLSIPKLKRLLILIFESIDEKNILSDITNFCNEIAYKKSKYVKTDFMYIEPKYDVIIKEALKQIYFE